MADRCQEPLCQHPGCWYSGEKKYGAKGRECPGYVQYIDNVLAKRKSKSFEACTTTSGSEDGLPFLTVTDIPTNLLPTSNHPPLPLQHPHSSRCGSGKDRSGQLTSPNLKFSIESPLYADRGRSPSPSPPEYDEYWFTPVLVWQPGKKSKRLSKQEEEKNDKVLKTTNLTDSLPDIPHAEHKDKRPISKAGARRSKSFRLSMDEYIMEGLSDVPSHIVSQIIQEIHSCSDNELVEDCLPTRPSKHSDTRKLHSSPFPFSNSITPSFKLRPLHSSVPSSVMLDLQSKKIQRTHPKEKRNGLRKEPNRRRSATSYSRALASHPTKALLRLKTRVTQLQEEAEQYYMFSKPPKTFLSDASSRFTDTDTLQQPVSIKSGPSYFTPRSLNKATVQRLMPMRTKDLVPSVEGRLDLSVLSTAKSRLRESVMHSLLIPPRPSIHVPLLPIHDRPFSEELSTIPPGSCPETYTRPDSRLSTLHSGSHMSSDRMIISADLASQTGELLLLNREGEVVHVAGTNSADTSMPTDTTNKQDTLLTDHKHEKADTSPTNLTQEEQDPLPTDVILEEGSPLESGSVAPPPTARGDKYIS